MRIAEKREKFVRDVTCFWNPDSDFRTGSATLAEREETGPQ
jgi:hypothetical protein